MPRVSFADLIQSGTPALGTWSQIASEECVDMLGAAGFAFTVIDCEHGAFGIETAEKLIRACDANGISPLVRAPALDRSFIARALDAGASAVVVPGIASAAQAQIAVSASRYAPQGNRGACPAVRSGRHMVRDWRAYVGEQHRRTGIVALVETQEGVDDIDAICAVEGLLALMVGPFDLSVSLGLDGDYLHPKAQDALDRMLAAARAARLPVIAPIFNPDPKEAHRQQAQWTAKGVRLFVVGTDKIIFADAARRYVTALSG